jgi:uncharacterized protein (DUF433 family)
MVSRLSRSVAPLYPIAEAARFARTHPQTLKRWARGYEVAGREYATLLVLPQERPRGEVLLSFENLIEAAIITAWRRRGIPLQRIRRAHVLAIAEFGEHPFARQDVYVGGRELFIRADEEVAENGRSFTQITAGGQRVFAPAVEGFLRSIDWRTGQETPYRWRPPEGDNEVTLNPEVEYGLPAVRRVRTETILHRFLARESAEEIADDFRLEVASVEHALRYEWSLTRAA